MALNFKAFVETPSRKKSKISIYCIAMLLVFYIIGEFVPVVNNALTSHCFRLLLICALWFAWDYLPYIPAKSWMKNSFFIYASHLILLQCIQRVIQILLGKIELSSSFLTVISYIILPIIIVWILLWVAQLCRKYVPHLFRILTGARA